MGFCYCSMFCCALLCVHSRYAIILKGKRELVALLCVSSWCLMNVVWLFLTVPQVVCSLWLWYFLIILTIFDAKIFLYLDLCDLCIFPRRTPEQQILNFQTEHNKMFPALAASYIAYFVSETKNFQHKILNIFLPIVFSICFGCSKEPSHWDGSFEYP